MNPENASIEPKLREGDLRDGVKGFWDGADIESFEPFLYPDFRIELVRKRNHNPVFLDGRTGEELEFLDVRESQIASLRRRG